MQSSRVEPRPPVRILVAASRASPFVMQQAGAVLARHGYDVVVTGANPASQVDDEAWQTQHLEAHLARRPVAVIVTDDGYKGILPLLRRRHVRPRVVTLGLSPLPAADVGAWSDAPPRMPEPGRGEHARRRALRLLTDRFLQLGVPGFEPAVLDVPQNIRFIGAFPLRPPDAGARTGQVLLAPEIAASGIRPVIHAAAKVLHGAEPVLAPTGVAAYAAALRHARVAVCGHSLVSVLLALQAGVPVLCLGRGEQAHMLAARLRVSGTGIGLPDTAPLAAIVPALRCLATLERFHHRAAALSIEFDEFDAVRLLLEPVRALAAIPPTGHSYNAAFPGNPHEDCCRHYSPA